MGNYTTGKQIKTIEEFDKALANNTLLFIPNWGKTAHPIILANMQYRIVKGFIKRNGVYLAKKISNKKTEKSFKWKGENHVTK